MALGDNYILRADLKAYMEIEVNTYDARIDAVCASVSREIEDHTHRQFNKSATATPRIYQPLTSDCLIVDDFYSTAGFVLETDDDDDGVFERTWTSSEYVLLPQGGIRNGREGWPFWMIKARRGASFKGDARLTVPWGWANVPSVVTESALMLGSDTFQVKDSRMGSAGTDQFGSVIRVRDNVIARNKLERYCIGRVRVK